MWHLILKILVKWRKLEVFYQPCTKWWSAKFNYLIGCHFGQDSNKQSELRSHLRSTGSSAASLWQTVNQSSTPSSWHLIGRAHTTTDIYLSPANQTVSRDWFSIIFWIRSPLSKPGLEHPNHKIAMPYLRSYARTNAKKNGIMY